jgi:predicted short-subunit dehydrogenase-like oxidoreductase (DUF2520 family)
VTDGREPDPAAELVLLCVPDSVIGEVAAAVPIGPWIAHVSGATTLGALDPHEQRFSVHPLQTLTRDRGDRPTIEAHLAALEARAPDLVPLYRALVEATKP